MRVSVLKPYLFGTPGYHLINICYIFSAKQMLIFFFMYLNLGSCFSCKSCSVDQVGSSFGKKHLDYSCCFRFVHNMHVHVGVVMHVSVVVTWSAWVIHKLSLFLIRCQTLKKHPPFGWDKNCISTSSKLLLSILSEALH